MQRNNAASSSLHGQWSTRLAFILAATGSAVGLGNIWGFPYKAGANGGGAFVLVYIGCVLLIGLPILIAEITLGRKGRASPIETMATIARRENRSPAWALVGAMGVLCGVLILSFYSVVAGWTLEYLQLAISGGLNDLNQEHAVALLEGENGILASPVRQIIWHSVFMILTALIVARGVKNGLESAVKLLMPLLGTMLVGLAIYSSTLPGAKEGLSFLFKPDFNALTPSVVLAAMGQAFFSLSLGMGALMAYGAYLPRDISIPKTAAIVACFDTSVALLAGIAIFPIVYTFGLEPGKGPGLVFVTLPLAFAQSGIGQFLACVFFLLLFTAALTSAISLMEPATAWLVEKTNMGRFEIALALGFAIWLVGIPSALAYNVLGGVKPFGMPILDLVDSLTTNIMLPLGGLFIALFTGWKISQTRLQRELHGLSTRGYTIWLWLVRIVAPAAITFIFLQEIGLLKFGQ